MRRCCCTPATRIPAITTPCSGCVESRTSSRAVLLRTLSFDLTYGPILRAEAVSIVGESSRLDLPDGALLAAPVSTGELRGEPARPQPQPLAGGRIGCSTRRPGSRTLSAGSSATTEYRPVMPASAEEMLDRYFTSGTPSATLPCCVNHPDEECADDPADRQQVRAAPVRRGGTGRRHGGDSRAVRRGRDLDARTPDSYRSRAPGRDATRSSTSSSRRRWRTTSQAPSASRSPE